MGKLRYSVILVAEMKGFHLVVPVPDFDITFSLKLLCESCGYQTEFIHLSADIVVPNGKKGNHNAVHMCLGNCRQKVGTIDIVKVYEDDNLHHKEKMVFVDLEFEGLVPVADELQFGFKWVAMEHMGKSTQPFWLRQNTQKRLVGGVNLSNGEMGSVSVQATFEFLGRI